MYYVNSLILMIALAAAAFAQDYEYGKIEELRGLKTVWVDTYGDINTRDRILAHIAKELPELRVVDDMLAAEIRIVYRGESEEVIQGATHVYGSTVLDRATLSAGRGIVGIEARGPDKTNPRLIINYQNRQQNKLERSPSVKFAKEFVKAYKRANRS